MRLSFPATIFALIAVLWIKWILPAASGIDDNDFMWHLAYGEWIMKHGSIPLVDSFSWTFKGQPYQLTQWLGEVALWLSYEQYGLLGTRILAVALTGVVFLFAWRAAARYVHTSAAMGIAVCCNIIQLMVPLRPQVFSFAATAIATYLIVRWIEDKKKSALMLYPVLMAAWVNLHGGFIVGLIMIGIVATGLTVEAYFEKRLKDERNTLILSWGVVVTSLLATLLNPYGYKAITGVLMIAGLQSSGVIFEWMPVTMTSNTGLLYLLNLLPFVGLMLATNVKPRITVGLLASFMLFFGVLANRQVAICAAVMAPMIASLLARAPQYREMVQTFANPSKPIIFGLLTIGLLSACGPILSGAQKNQDRALEDRYPVQATKFLVANNLTERVLSDTVEGSWLIHQKIPVFIDGRMDLYQDKFFFEWYLADRAVPGWNDFIQKHNPNVMLLRVDMAIRQAALTSGQWKQVYQDQRFSVLVPSSNPLPSVAETIPKFLDDKGHLTVVYKP